MAACGERPLLCTELSRHREAALEDSARAKGVLALRGGAGHQCRGSGEPAFMHPLSGLCSTAISEGLTVLSGRHGPMCDVESGVFLLPRRSHLLHCSGHFFLCTQGTAVLSAHDASADRVLSRFCRALL